MFSVTIFQNKYLFNSRTVLNILRRWKSNKKNKKSSCDLALQHFDQFYKSIFKKKWPSVRLALLSESKQVAVVNNFADIEETENFLKQKGALNLRSFLEIEKKNYDKKVLTDPVQDESESDEKYERQDEKNFMCSKEEDETSAEFIKDNNSSEIKMNKKDYFSNPEEVKTSLQSDLLNSEIEFDRLIMPDSAQNKEILHQFIPTTQLLGKEGFVPEADYYKYYKEKEDVGIKIDQELHLDFPENLKAYVFDRGDITQFPTPTKSANDVYNYLLVDGAELLTALALGVNSGDAVLHISPYTGNIGYCIFQTLCPKILTCSGEKNLFQKLFVDYLFDYSAVWKDMLLLTSRSFINFNESDLNLFDKILVDVPCTQDKKSLFETDDNIFSQIHIKARLQLPNYQTKCLSSALKLVKPGGAVVYTTSTLSPIQNEAVVSEAIKVVLQETNDSFTVRNLSSALAHTSLFYNFGNNLPMRYGTLIVPFLPSNFGPRYFCKIVKNT